MISAIAAFGYGIAVGMPLDTIVSSVNAGFGGTIGYIGIRNNFV